MINLPHIQPSYSTLLSLQVKSAGREGGKEGGREGRREERERGKREREGREGRERERERGTHLASLSRTLSTIGTHIH